MSQHADDFGALREFDTPTVSNALEFFELRPKNVGFLLPGIMSAIPRDTPMIGYAVTAECSASKPPTPEQLALMEPYYRSVRQTPHAIAVVKDIDAVPAGSFWGEVNASIHKSLGCIGTITDGGVRDIAEVEKLNFGYFSSSVMVSHSYIHLETIGQPVVVGGCTVTPGDLIHADRHGVLVIPPGLDLEELVEACRAAAFAEEPVIRNCQESVRKGKIVDIEDLMGWRKEMLERKKQAIRRFSKK